VEHRPKRAASEGAVRLVEIVVFASHLVFLPPMGQVVRRTRTGSTTAGSCRQPHSLTKLCITRGVLDW